ncbi:MAG: tRNA pseudouridine(55) synthase TruB [Oscillospiraceae bacterium]|jgi:tRNA pseudouridine55 synthase
MSFNGILPVDKPEGFTSFDVIAKLRGMFRTRRIGHAGTLDPGATGVLLLFLGGTTRFISFLPNHDKRYTAVLRLGIVTDTQDMAGHVLKTRPVLAGRAEVEQALQSFLGEQQQIPPMYSAVQKDGRRLYELARQGLEVEREPRTVTIYDITLLDASPDEGLYTLDITCSAGTYIRTLCHDLGQKLGCGGAMASLRRTWACGFSLNSCRTLEELQALAGEGRLEQGLLPLESAFAQLPRLELDTRASSLFLNGAKLSLQPLGLTGDEGQLAVYSGQGQFLGLAAPDGEKGELRHLRVYARQ